MTWWSIAAEFLYKVADYLWKRHEAKMQARGAPLTDAEEADDITKLPHK